MTNLKVLTFNVHNALANNNGVLTDAAKTRVAAVKAEIESHSPDLVGLQEDITLWTNNLTLDGYTAVYDPNVTGNWAERCAIYYKSELNCVDYGWQWLTSDGSKSTVALTVADILPGGKYEMTPEELARIDVTASTKDSFLRDGITYYINDAGARVSVSSYNYLTARRMTYVVLEVNGQNVIYVNTHLQHRSQNAEYSSPAMQKLRNSERLAQFAMVQARISELKVSYPNAAVVITGDFNDLIGSDVYNLACENYQSAKVIAATVEGSEGTWNNYYTNPNASNYGTDTLDYVFVYGQGLTVSKYTTGVGYATVNGEKIYTSDHLAVVVDFSI